jgi:ABC-type transport system involved in multi-copper enzyme maturation permease subunit
VRAVNAMAEVGLVVGRELRKNFRSVKGIVLAVLTLLGGFGVSMLLVWAEQMRRDTNGLTPEMVKAGQMQLLAKVYGEEQGRYLADAPDVLLVLLNITVWLGPLLIALMSFDALSGEIQYRAVRYWTVRTRRSSYYAGKFLGVWAVVSAITLAMSAVIWAVTIARGYSAAGPTLGWGIRFWLVSLPLSAAWCGIATLVGSQFRTPILSLLVIFATFFVVWLVRVVAGVAGWNWLAHIYPNFYDSYMLSPRIEEALKGFGGCAAFVVLTLGAGILLFQKRDV